MGYRIKGFIKLISVILAFLLLSLNLIIPQAAYEDYTDVTGHWAQAVLRQAYNDGIIVGEGNSLLPDANATAAQVLTILCRVLGAQMVMDISGWGLPTNAWYYGPVSRAAYLGLVTSSEAKTLSAPISRQNAFYLIAEAFQLIEAKPDLSVLDQFADSGLIDNARRQAMASLVSQGLLVGYGGKLHVNSYATRAEVLTLLYRIVEEFTSASGTNVDYKHGVVLKGSADLSGNSFSKGVWFNCTASDISLNEVKANRIVIRSHSLSSLVIGASTHIDSLTLAAQAGSITVSPADGATVNNLVVGTGKGQVTTSGINAIEVSGNNRIVIINESAEKVVISGRNNIIHISSGAKIGKIELLRGAPDCRVIVDGDVQELEIIGLRAKIEGSGYVDKLVLSRNHVNVDVKHGEILDIIDQGIIEATVKISMPNRLPVGDKLNASATLENVANGKKCGITWYVNNVLVKEATMETGANIPGLLHSFAYSRTMKDSADIRVSIKYVTAQGEHQEISTVNTIKLDNYSKRHWMQSETQAVLNKVITEYKGDFTLDWTLKNDYDDFEKEVWVYAKGYSSSTDYLLWVNIAYQRLNIFKWKDGNWELIRECIVGTGAIGSQTKRGVTTITYKQLNGWTTRDYTVKPVVRFWPSSGYAFHSRIYYPNTDTIKNPSIGFPVSLGCIRMYDEDIWYLYDNIPNGSTVVIY